jgi:excisionase family DNA binding protein
MRGNLTKLVPAEKLAVNAEQAGQMLSLSRSKIYELMHSGELPFIKIGKSRRVLVSDLLKLIERNKHAE